MLFKNWKECAWKNLNDGKDSGLNKVSRAFAIDRHKIIKFTHNIQHKAFWLPSANTNKQLLASGKILIRGNPLYRGLVTHVICLNSVDRISSA